MHYTPIKSSSLPQVHRPTTAAHVQHMLNMFKNGMTIKHKSSIFEMSRCSRWRIHQWWAKRVRPSPSNEKTTVEESISCSSQKFEERTNASCKSCRASQRKLIHWSHCSGQWLFSDYTGRYLVSPWNNLATAMQEIIYPWWTVVTSRK